MRFRIKATITALAPLFSFPILLGGCAGLGTAAAGRLNPSEQMMWSTYAIGTSKGMATAIIINKKDRSAPNGLVPVLVTATHVLAAAPQGPYYLAIRTPNPRGNPHVSILAFQPAWLDQAIYMHHPQQDIAALELRIPPPIAEFVQLSSFIDEDAIARDGDDPHAGDPVSLLGFPKVMPGTEGAFPILRSARIASYSLSSTVAREKFLLNASVCAGDSGGPVFAGRGRDRKPILLGIVTERIGKELNEVPLAIAVDAHAVRETLQLLAQHRDRIASRSLTSAHTATQNETVKLKGPPEIFFKIVRGEKQAAMPLPVAKPK
jgi:Trypsin